MRAPLTGRPCDSTHPFPAPAPADWIDSMEYGADHRSEHSNSIPTEDTDTSPTWRALGASIWNADCQQAHLEEIAASTILTTHLLAVAMLSRKSLHPVESLALGQVGAGGAIEALLNEGGGLEAAHEQVRLMGVDGRRRTVAECIAVVMKGYTNLQLDIYAHYH